MGLLGSTRKLLAAGFTLVETVLALAVLTIVLMAFNLTTQRALLLSETNKQIKIALLDAESVVEEIQGVPIDSIMDPDFPTPSVPTPRYRHLQYIDPRRLFGTDPNNANASNPPHLKNEQIRVWYGSGPETSNIDVKTAYPTAVPLAAAPPPSALLPSPADRSPSSDYPPAPSSPILYLTSPGSGTVVVDHAVRWNVAAPLPIVPGSGSVTYLDFSGGHPPEQYRPANNHPGSAPSDFVVPDPLYVTVEVSWTGPSGLTMYQRVTFVRSR